MGDFTFRILFRLGMTIDSRAKAITVPTPLCPLPLFLKARTGTLGTSRGLVLESNGYESEAIARKHGTHVLNAMLIGGIVRRLGVDVGTGKKRLQFSDSIKQKYFETGATLREEVEGLDVYGDPRTVFLIGEGYGTVKGSPEDVSGLIDSAGAHPCMLTDTQKIAAELLNDSLFEVSIDAAFVLRISAIEALCPQEASSPAYVDLAAYLRSTIPPNTPSAERQAMQRLLDRDTTRQSVRSAYMEKFRRLIGNEKAKEFDRLYNLRSKFLHEGLGRGKLQESANSAMELAQALFLSDIAHTNT